jgi:hypothetical protein
MRKLVPILTIVIFIVSSCKTEDTKPQPVAWDENWCVFEGDVIYSGDTTHIGFSSNQGYECTARGIFIDRIIPWSSEARWVSEITGNPGIKITKGMVYYNYTNRPDDSTFLNFFRSGYYQVFYESGNGLAFEYTDELGRRFSTDEDLDFWDTVPNYMYTCRISDYHPFVRNGVQYVKVKMDFSDILLREVNGWDPVILRNFHYEGYFKND